MVECGGAAETRMHITEVHQRWQHQTVERLAGDYSAGPLASFCEQPPRSAKLSVSLYFMFVLETVGCLELTASVYCSIKAAFLCRLFI